MHDEDDTTLVSRMSSIYRKFAKNQIFIGWKINETLLFSF